jgi:hypothetical protein
MLKYILTATILAVLSLAPMSLAQTADGKTPALEEDCNGLNGALYGLCVAYCEAMDCDFVDTQASYEACWQVKDNYEFLSGGNLPPCDYEKKGSDTIDDYEENDSDDTNDLG